MYTNYNCMPNYRHGQQQLEGVRGGFVEDVGTNGNNKGDKPQQWLQGWLMMIITITVRLWASSSVTAGAGESQKRICRCERSVLSICGSAPKRVSQLGERKARSLCTKSSQLLPETSSDTLSQSQSSNNGTAAAVAALAALPCYCALAVELLRPNNSFFFFFLAAWYATAMKSEQDQYLAILLLIWDEVDLMMKL